MALTSQTQDYSRVGSLSPPSAQSDRPGPTPRIGVLALQGDFARHAAVLQRLGTEVLPVRRVEELDGLDGLIVPGGESTTLTKLLDASGLRDPLIRFARTQPILATCAGTILLATHLEHQGATRSLGILDMTVERNAYGRQVDSFEAPVTLVDDPDRPFPGVFIRAPRLVAVGERLKVTAWVGEEPVMVEGDRVMAATFHPELTDDGRIHQRFLTQCSKRRAETAGRETG